MIRHIDRNWYISFNESIYSDNALLCCGEYDNMLDICAIDNIAIVTVDHDICDTLLKLRGA